MRESTAVAGDGPASDVDVAGNVVSVRFTGALDALSAADRRALFDRTTSSAPDVRDRTAEIVAQVRSGGDAALRSLARELDGVALEALEVPRAAAARALEQLAPDLRRAFERAARNIAEVHRAALPQPVVTSPEPGIVIARRPDPLRRVGVYAPGGRATYPSSVLMGAIPARVAGVGEVILCSPPDRATGRPADVILAAAAIAGVDRIFAIGGAGAVAAMAYGTEQVPRVDRVIGPGNAFVAEAKLQLSGVVGIDSPAGPSELLVLADTRADADVIAREVVAQAEHDPLACAVVVVFPSAAADGGDPAEQAVAITRAIARQVDAQPRGAIVRESLATSGAVLTAVSGETAVAFAGEYAPEHLLVIAEDADTLVPRVRNAGTVFVGECSSNAFGDYMTGANHVLPTGGLARSYSGLSILDFYRWTTVQQVDRRAAAALAGDVACFAESEGLPGHAAAARAWGGLGEEPAS